MKTFLRSLFSASVMLALPFVAMAATCAPPGQCDTVAGCSAVSSQNPTATVKMETTSDCLGNAVCCTVVQGPIGSSCEGAGGICIQTTDCAKGSVGSAAVSPNDCSSGELCCGATKPLEGGPTKVNQFPQYTYQDPLGGLSAPALIARIIGQVLPLIGMLFLVMFLWGGFLWLSAADDTKKVTKARQTLINATIGMLIVLSAYILVGAIIASLGTSLGQ